jgi:hypothetical protein
MRTGYVAFRTLVSVFAALSAANARRDPGGPDRGHKPRQCGGRRKFGSAT